VKVGSVAAHIKEIKRDEKRRKDGFSPIERNFYAEVRDELERLQIEAKKYFDMGDYENGGALTEEITKLKNSLEEIVDLRLRKILMATVSESIKTKNLTRDEMDFYNDMKLMVENFRKFLITGERGNVVVEPLPIQDETNNKNEERVEVQEEETSKNLETTPQEKINENYVLIRVVAPVTVALSGNRALVLRKEDVLHIPEMIYKGLLKRGKVAEIKIE